MSDRKAVIKNADMGEEMQQDAVDCATQALEKYNIEKVRKISPRLPRDSKHPAREPLRVPHNDLKFSFFLTVIPKVSCY